MANGEDIKQELREIEKAFLDALTMIDELVGVIGDLTLVRDKADEVRSEVRQLRHKQPE